MHYEFTPLYLLSVWLKHFVCVFLCMCVPVCMYRFSVAVHQFSAWALKFTD